MVDKLRDPFRFSFELSKAQTEEMNFRDVETYADIVFARDFEGLPLIHPFSEDEMKSVRNVNKWG